MTVTWITPSGSLRVIPERVLTEIPLSASSTKGAVSFQLIAGKLPRGLRLSNGLIVGSPTEVIKLTTSRFVIRAFDGEDIDDRTFSISVDGADSPEWITREGYLKVGPGNAYFVLDNSPVSFQLETTDTDLTAGDTLKYYLLPRGGELPPGLTLSSLGLISGFTDPIFSIQYSDSEKAGYDQYPFDEIPQDFQAARKNGYDSFFYDTTIFDFEEESLLPRRLSRSYNFVILVSDGIHSITRQFKIYVVTEEFLKADNTIIQVGTGVFTADSAAVRTPSWITDSNLGRFRANNYVTIFLEVFNPSTLPGIISILKLPKNSDGSDSEFPPGLELDSTTGLLSGKVPYQTRITKEYKFTVIAIYFPFIEEPVKYVFRDNWSPIATYVPNDTVRYQGFIYVCKKTNKNKDPSQIEFWEISTSQIEKTFTVELFGEIDSAIEWITDSNLGSIKPNQSSLLNVEARGLIYGNRVAYEFVSGALPPGLQFLPNGIIQGKVRQFADSTGLGLLRFYDLNEESNEREFNMTFDGDATSFDKKFTFTIKARDSSNFAQVNKTFFVTVNIENEITFANLYITALQAKEKRLLWTSFITNVSIFPPEDLFRYGDLSFSTQTDLKMLVYAGIETKEAVNYVQAMSRNHYRKRMLFRDVRSAEAKDPVTQKVLYEVVYVELVDEYEKNNTSISETVPLPKKINSPVLVSYDAIRIDSDIPLVSNQDHQRVFPNSIKNMRKRIKNIGERDRDLLPLWMRSIQKDTFFESGYVKSLVLCYAKPGKSEIIKARIKASNFDFKNLDFLADRYIIDILDGEIQDKYLAFPQRDVLNKLSNPSQPVDAVFTVTAGTFDSNVVFFDSEAITFDQD